MIVHLFEDEKFVDTTIEKFEKIAEGENRYIVFSDAKSLKHPKRTDKIEIYPNSWYKIKLEKIFKDCRLIIVHYLTPIKGFIIKNKPNRIPVVWMVWGKDAYDFFEKYEQYEPITSSYLRADWRTKLKKTKLYDGYHFIKYGVNTIDKERGISSKINYITTVLPTEFELIKKEFNLNAKYIPYNYDSLNILFSGTKSYVLGENILIGNSATPSNNHLDVFSKIVEFKQEVIVPLNYGDMNYKNVILENGIKTFGSKFRPLTHFMPFEEYQNLVFSCNSMVMYHIRQQGLGNILLALYVGIRVFLNTKSTTYKYLNKIGFRIYDLQNDNEVLGVELEREEKSVNKALVIQYWGPKKILEGVNNVVNIIKK